METFGRIYEEFKVQANDLVDKVRQLIHEGNVRRIILKDENGATYMEIPLTVATISVIAAPALAAVGALAAALSKFTVVVERAASVSTGPAPGGATKAHASGIGATEEQVNMKDTVGQRIDPRGGKLEDLGGVGEHDALGG